MIDDVLHVAPHHGDLRRIRPWLERRMPGLDDELRGRVELAVHELATNVLDHAGVPDPALELRVHRASDRLRVELRDRGRPAELPGRDDLEPHPRVGGYGLVIVDALALVEHARVGDENVWTLGFELSAPDGPHLLPSPPMPRLDDMALRIGRKTEVKTITLSGRLDAVEATPLRSLIGDHLTTGHSRLIVDLSSVEFVDSAGLAALVIGMKRARLQGGDLRLIRPVHPDAQRVFALTKFAEVFHMSDGVESAGEGW